MQKGIATFEILLVMLITAFLMTTTLPNADNILDKVYLDHETKRIYARLRYLRSFDKLTDMADTHFDTTYKGDVVSLETNDYFYFIRQSSKDKIYEQYRLPSGFKLSRNKQNQFWKIQFDDMGKVSPAISDTLKINSRKNRSFSIVFDSVGRFKGGRE